MTPEETYEKQVIEAARKERIYEPKYGGKDHSGYDTLMLYEVNYEREDCFEKGVRWANKHPAPHIQKLVEALSFNELTWATISCECREINGHRDACPKCQAISIAQAALQEYERAEHNEKQK